MARGDMVFAKTWVKWPDDPRCQALTHLEYRLNSYLWLACVEQRRDTLPSHYNFTYWSRRCRTTLKTISRSFRHMEELGLLSVNEDKSVTLFGVKDSHHRFNWREDTYGDVTGQDGSREDKEGDKDKEKDKEKTGSPPAHALKPEETQDHTEPNLLEFHDKFKAHNTNSIGLVKFEVWVDKLLALDVPLAIIQSIYLANINKALKIWELEAMVMSQCGLTKTAPAKPKNRGDQVEQDREAEREKNTQKRRDPDACMDMLTRMIEQGESEEFIKLKAKEFGVEIPKKPMPEQSEIQLQGAEEAQTEPGKDDTDDDFIF